MNDNTPVDGRPAFTPPDENLWVMVRGTGKVYVIGNAHTFFGRIAGYSESLRSGYIFSLSEVEDASPSARAWIDGFLAGNEPDLDEYLGFGEVWDLGDNDPDVVRWIDACRRFRRGGYMPPVPKRPRRQVPANPLLPKGRLWSPAGEQVWVWDGEGWSIELPQPQLIDNDFLVGTVCDERARHAEWTAIPPAHEVCCDCGRVIEYSVGVGGK
jgi:hypothetical protein